MFTAYVITCTKIGCCVLELIISIYNIYMYIYNIYVYIWHELNRVQFPVLVQVFNQCAWSPDMRHKEMTIQERGRSRPGSGSTYGKQHFPTAVLQSRIVAIGAPLSVHFSLGSMCSTTHTHTALRSSTQP